MVHHPLRGLTFTASLLCSVAFAATLCAGDRPSTRPAEQDVARRTDELFKKLLPAGAAMAAPAPDEDFNRRATLDLTGKVPESAAVLRFKTNTAASKRALLIDELLKSDAYAVNWGRYWRDVITYHSTASANYLNFNLFDTWLTEQVRNNRSWDQVVTSMVTATGASDEYGNANFLTGLYGSPKELANTTSRVFMGVQLQCAECHDAKAEPWKREQFHEFAAFFGKIRIVQEKEIRVRQAYAIHSMDAGQYQMVDKKDPNKMVDMQPRFLVQPIPEAQTITHGMLAVGNLLGSGPGVTPAFMAQTPWVLDGQVKARHDTIEKDVTLSVDASDHERRAFLAKSIVGSKWFARAYVNRIWTSLMGWGFYYRVDDVGSGLAPRYEEVLDMLAKEWIASGYDNQWLFRTMMLTNAYQGRLQSPPPNAKTLPGASVCPSRLRAEQIFEALVRALDINEKDQSLHTPTVGAFMVAIRHIGPRRTVYETFKEDPSLSPEEVHGTIPQALLMMNSAMIHRFTSAKGKTVLAELIAEGKDNREIIGSLYLRVLARDPSDSERAICRSYMSKVGSREEALEDILWSLINSTEFLTKK